MTQFGWNDACPLEVRHQVNSLVEGVHAILGESLVGVYLHGSLAMGCFNPRRSDLDLLVVIGQRASVERKRKLAELLLRVSLAPVPIEISLLARDQIHPWRHPAPFDLHFSEAWRDRTLAGLASGEWRTWNDSERCDEDLAGHITVVRQRGICLHGAPITAVFPAVPTVDYLASVLTDVLSPDCGLNSALASPVYVILNACRTYAYLSTGQVLSKDEGGVWALQVIPHQFHATVQSALAAYRADQDDRRLAHEDVVHFAAYMRGEIERLNRLT
jgi:predicted nucleotidyltransferase